MNYFSFLRACTLAVAVLSIVPALAQKKEAKKQPAKVAVQPQISQWEVDPYHSSVHFSVKHLQVSEVEGKFKEFKGNFAFDPKHLDHSKLNFEIHSASVDTDVSKRDEHIRSKDFLDAAEFPMITFKSKKIDWVEGKHYKATGEFTLRGTSKEIEIPFEITDEIKSPMKENTWVMGMKFTTKIKRSDYGVGIGDWLSDAVVGDIVDITIPLELHKNK